MRPAADRLPVAALVSLAAAGFITILTEALPAGLLTQIGHGLGVREALAGQWVSVFALGSLAAAIPLTAATRGWRRRPLLLCAIAGFVGANGVTAATQSFAVSLVARWVGGVSAGLVWALLAGYAVRLAPAHRAGRAMAIAMAGTPVALSVGIPAGTLLGDWAGWRAAFAVLGAAAALLAGWMALYLPDFPGEEATHRPSLRQVFLGPGLRPVLLLTLTFVLAHNILYTYVALLLAEAGAQARTDSFLLTFGLAGLLGLAAAGLWIDRYLRALIALGIALFAVAVVLLMTGSSAAGPYGAALFWGLGFGGAATLFQTASARAAGRAADVAQAMIDTAWNLAIVAGAVRGGYALDRFGAGLLPATALPLLIVAACATSRIGAGPPP